ncbi:ester cyclase [Streptomyces oryzae]|uniref:Ester cyclase n=1 Tax=Streptomyces oryzae TaxID=1434886 RepID=A0ABS3XKA2_9ACTN|nr:nuclear transport factor 2 family protein [Streptomyces oryzae]MBO8195501.1 ester cyclase [Streptomyces oryzae]
MTDHKSVFRAYLHAFNTGDLEAFDDLVTEDYRNHDPLHPDPEPGPAGLKPIVSELRAQAPDLRFEEVHLIVEDDLLAAHLLVHGFGEAPVRQIQIERFAGDRIAEHWRATGSGA